MLGGLKKILNELETTLEGVFLLKEFSDKTHDKIVSFGERLSAYIVINALQLAIKKAQYKDSRDLIITDDNFTQASVQKERTEKNIQAYFENEQAPIVVMPGFIASNRNAETTTLGRGGSDYTAAILAAALEATNEVVGIRSQCTYTGGIISNFIRAQCPNPPLQARKSPGCVASGAFGN